VPDRLDAVECGKQLGADVVVARRQCRFFRRREREARQKQLDEREA
jgi:hypothetical protein